MDTGTSGSILQQFGFKLVVRASRVAKILVLELCFGSVLERSRCYFSSALALDRLLVA